MAQSLTFPWRASLAYGDQYSAILDSKRGEKVQDTFLRGMSIAVTEADKTRLEAYVVFLPLPKAGLDDRHIHEQPIYTVRPIFSFEPNPSGQRVAG